MKIKLMDIAIIIFFICFIAILIYIAVIIKADSLQCMSNPIAYIQNKTGANCFCWKDIK